MINLTKYFRGDKYIWLIVLFLSMFGLAAVYSSTGALAFRTVSGNTEFYVIRQALFMLLGVGVMYVIHLADFRYFSKIAKFLVFFTIPLVVFTYMGEDDYQSAKRVLTIPVVGISFQVFDIVKFSLIVYIARFLSIKQDDVKSWRTFINVFLVIIVMCLMIAPEDLSTSLVLFTTSLILLFIGRINLKYLAGLLVVGGIIFATLFTLLLNIDAEDPKWHGTRVPTWKSRVESYMSSEGDGSYQTQQAKIAVVRGGLLGQGPGGSTQRNFLPEAYSDFIFCVIIEEYGLLFGAIPLLVLYLVFFYRSIKILMKSPNAFGALLAVGLSLALTTQALVNMAVAVSLFPVTGLTLPLISNGGTSVLFTSIGIGIILSVSRTVEKETLEIEE